MPTVTLPLSLPSAGVPGVLGHALGGPQLQERQFPPAPPPQAQVLLRHLRGEYGCEEEQPPSPRPTHRPYSLGLLPGAQAARYHAQTQKKTIPGGAEKCSRSL